MKRIQTKKNSPKERSEEKMIDIHCHILPKVDDGPQNMKESIAMARLAYGDGIRTIVNTSHYIDGEKNQTGERLEKNLDDFQRSLEDEGLDLKILMGNEAIIAPNLPMDVKEKKVFTINHSNYLLVELPLGQWPIYVEDVLYELQLEGITPIIAHPERYPKIMEDPNILYEWVSNGILTQVNGGSFIGKFGKSTKKTAHLLLEHELIHFIGSDGHSSRSRRPLLSSTYGYIEKKYGSNTRYKLEKNGHRLINNQKITSGKPTLYKPKKYFLSLGLGSIFSKS